ncbi:hypothetical protein [Novosphingobium sp.]|uniref:hypothetical protein n=1 Tax=Novosphingobium sp. TaxID=1874826 RepID=UPI003BAAE284
MIRLLPSRSLLLVLAPLLLLGACGKSSTPQAGPTASGEILPGSVSDAMLDTDRSQAQAPLAPVAHSAAPKVDTSAAADASDPATDAAAPTEAGQNDQEVARPKPANTSKPTTP